MGVWSYTNDNQLSRTIRTCLSTSTHTNNNCDSDTITFVLLFTFTFLIFSLLDVAPINMFALSGDWHRIQVIFTELFLCSIVAFLVADIALDLFRTHIHWNNWLWHLAWMMPFILSLLARLGPCLICCLPTWARSHQARANRPEVSMAINRTKSGREITVPERPTMDLTNAAKSVIMSSTGGGRKKSAKQKFKDKRKAGTLRRAVTKAKSKRRITLTGLPAVFGVQNSGKQREAHALAAKIKQATKTKNHPPARHSRMLKQTSSIVSQGRDTPTILGRVDTVTSIDGDRFAHGFKGTEHVEESITACCDRDVCCWCLPHPLDFLRHQSDRLRMLLHFLFAGPTWDLYETYSALLSIFSVYIYLQGTYETSSYRVQVSDTGQILPTISGFRPAYKEDCPSVLEWQNGGGGGGGGTGNGNRPWTHLPQQYIECALVIDWVLRLLVSRKTKWKKFSSIYMLSDLLSMSRFPIWVLKFPLKLYRSFGCLRFLRLLRLSTHYAIASRLSKIQLKKWRVYMIVTSLFMVTAGLILTVEYGEESGFICFHDALYFSVVSLLTVGLGDLAPISVTGRILSTFMLIVGVATVSYQLNELEAANRREARFKYTGCLSSSIERHMILCGDVMHVDSIKVFLEEFCHPNHRGVDDLRLPTIILLCPHPPSTELEHLLEVMMSRDRKDGGTFKNLFFK